MTDRTDWPEPRVPKYYGLKRHLQELILAAQPGSPLPPERILAAEFSLSRTSVRQALYELVVEGRLERVQGRGTFVAQAKRSQQLRLGLSQPGADGETRTELLDAELLTADDETAGRLGLRRNARALRVERLRREDGEPVAVEAVWLAPRRFAALARRLPKATGADPLGAAAELAEALAEAYGTGPVTGEEAIEVVLAGPREAALLGTDVGAPLLLLSKHIRDSAGDPVEWVQAWYRGDRSRFVLDVP
jgi:GntR family transcriptional regulator